MKMMLRQRTIDSAVPMDLLMTAEERWSRWTEEQRQMLGGR